MAQTAEKPQAAAGTDAPARERMNIVVIGHVDHGKSTVVGRLLADTGSLPQGKLEQVKATCARNARPFEYAFLLDALADEQAQGITIDSARCFFKSARRDYIIIDAPGHVEFLKNMISGAARAEAGLLVIDAKEGVRENSRRHGYLMSMLGIRQVAVLVNKLDLVDYSQEVFESIRREYAEFLRHVGIVPAGFLPISAREGDNIVEPSPRTPWYDGPTVLGQVDAFTKEPPRLDKPLRMPLQDVYRFTEAGDDRRIFAGRIETGSLRVGDEVVFWPSQKRSRVATVEAFNVHPPRRAVTGQSTGFTLDTQIYVKPGELVSRADEPAPRVAKRLRVNLFWLGRQPMIPNKRYKLKLAGARIPAWLTAIHTVMDASNLSTDTNRRQIERHDVAECTLETLKPVAWDPAVDIAQTGRFVIIDNYEIAGGGIILDAAEQGESMLERHVRRRERAWERTGITPGMRAGRYGQRAALVLITGTGGPAQRELATALEENLFNAGRLVYWLGLSNTRLGIDSDLSAADERDEFLRRLGEIAHLFTDAGVILLASVSELDDYELEMIDTLNRPGELLVVNVGENRLTRRAPDLLLDGGDDVTQAIRRVKELLAERNYLLEYYL